MKVPLLKFVGGPVVPLLNFEGVPGILLLNFRRVPGPTLNFEGGPGSRVPGPRVPRFRVPECWSHFYTMPSKGNISAHLLHELLYAA